MRPRHWWYTVPLRLRSLVWRRRVERDLDDEVRFHLERQIDADVARGIDPDEARYLALRAFGGVDQRKEECRDMRHVRIVDDVVQDVHYAVRVLRRSPGFAVAAILIMALGIGANSAMFSLIHAVLLRDLPYPDADRLVRMVEQGNNGPMWVAWPDFVDWRTMARSFESMGAVRQEGFTVNGLKDPIRVEGQRATAEIFTLAGASMAAGRALTRLSDTPGAPLEAVLSQKFSREHFANDASAVGRMIDVDGESCLIVGVLGADSRLFMDADIVVSFAGLARVPAFQSRGNHFRTVAIGKLKPGVSAESADTEMQQIARALERTYPGTNAGVRVASTSLHESVVGGLRPMALTLAAAVGLLLLIACANVASLLLARVPARRRELALRMTLGAGRLRIARQLVTESVVLALAGGAAGLTIGSWVVGVVRGFALPGIPRLDTAQTDWTVLGVTFAVSLLTGIVFGLAPAWRGTRSEIGESLQQGGRGASVGAGRLGAALTIAEVALSLLLLVGAGLLIRSFTLLLDVNPGFNPRGVLAVQLNLPAASYPEVRTRQFYGQLLERLGSLPGVQSAGAARSLPVLGSGWTSGYIVRDQPTPAGGDRPSASFNPVSGDYFRTMQIRLLEGRSFGEQDRQDAPSVVVVTRAFARRHWPDGTAIGRQVSQGGDGPWRTVVGVVQDLKQSSLDKDCGAEIFLPLDQSPPLRASVVVRAHDRSPDLAAAVRRELRAVDPTLPIGNVALMDDLVGETLVSRRATMAVLSLFAALALVLAAAGIYGVLAYSVAQRTREFGVRTALGASGTVLIRQVLWRGAKLALSGVGVGLLLAPILTRFISTQLFGVGSLDPITFVAAGVMVVGLSLLACWVPARRASAVDPVQAIRAD
jgi:predicted permease